MEASRSMEIDGAGESVPMEDNQPSTSGSEKPTVIIVIGMAGSGKTTLLSSISSYLKTQGTPGYLINLDPAVMHLGYRPNIDIRDTVIYKRVMEEYKLGPNGGILTSLNMFATRFDQVIALCEKRRDPQPKYIVVDTPGQIEIFTWSASGAIITDAFASTFPTVIAYVIDTPRCTNPQTFMSNMLQACSILYKTRLPLLLLFNKADVMDPQFAADWMKDLDTFTAAIEKETSYAATLSRSMSLVLEEFYSTLRQVGVSATEGRGLDDLFQKVGECRQEYNSQYRPELERRRKVREEEEARRQAAQLQKLQLDRAPPGGAPNVA